MAELVLQYEAPFGATRKFWLRSGERVIVGSTCWADHTVEFDRVLSPIHFAIEHTGAQALIRDLDSTAGISCNGQSGSEFILRNGDKIQAGETDFFAHVSGRLVRPSKPIAEQPTAANNANAIDYVVRRQANGLTKFTSTDAGSAASFANALIGKSNVVAVTTAKAIDSLPLPWKSLGIHAGDNSMLLELSDPRDSVALGLIGQAHEYIVLAAESSIESLRRLVGAVSMLRMQCRVIRAQLVSGPPQYIESLLPDIGVVMLPDEDSSGVQVFAKTQHAEPWLEIGCPPPQHRLALD